MKVLVTRSCPTLCDPMDCSPARLLWPWGVSRQEHLSGEWVAIPLSKRSSRSRDRIHLGTIKHWCVRPRIYRQNNKSWEVYRLCSWGKGYCRLSSPQGGRIVVQAPSFGQGPGSLGLVFLMLHGERWKCIFQVPLLVGSLPAAESKSQTFLEAESTTRGALFLTSLILSFLFPFFSGRCILRVLTCNIFHDHRFVSLWTPQRHDFTPWKAKTPR